MAVRVVLVLAVVETYLATAAASPLDIAVVLDAAAAAAAAVVVVVVVGQFAVVVVVVVAAGQLAVVAPVAEQPGSGQYGFVVAYVAAVAAGLSFVDPRMHSAQKGQQLLGADRICWR